MAASEIPPAVAELALLNGSDEGLAMAGVERGFIS